MAAPKREQCLKGEKELADGLLRDNSVHDKDDAGRDQDGQGPGPFDVPEELESQPPALVGTLDDPRNIGNHEGTEILNLQYRQGPDLPTLEYGFPDSHFICFPYESRRTGIYPTGAAREPMDGLGSREDATGAALKAIQSISRR